MKSSNTIALNSKVSHLHPVPTVTDWEQVLTDWVKTKRSPHTQRVYRKDIENFLTDTGVSLGGFLSLDRFGAFEILNRYRGDMLSKRLTAATINRRLSAIKSLVTYCYHSGRCEFILDGIKGERLTPYRDTTGIKLEQFKPMLEMCDLSTLKGLRDYAILILLWANALRRSEVAMTNVKDFDPIGESLKIYGKGRGNESETISLGKSTVKAISDYLAARGKVNPSDPLFVAHKTGYEGHRLTTKTIYNIVKETAEKSGIKKVMSPHRVRHSAITAALDATNGDVRRVQKLSRHKNLNTLLIYDDNRQNLQGEVTSLLDSML